MRRIRALAAVALAALCLTALLAPTAAGRGQDVALTSVRVFGISHLSRDTVIGGQLRSEGGCVANRTVQLIATFDDGSKSVLDRGRSSSDGAVAAEARSADFEDAAKLVLKVTRETRDGGEVLCIQGSTKVEAGPARAAPQTFGTAVGILGVNGAGRLGVFWGVVRSPRAKCFANRHLTLKNATTGEVLDAGASTSNGAWALHVRFASEFNSSDTFKVIADRKTFMRDNACAAAQDTYQQVE